MRALFSIVTLALIGPIAAHAAQCDAQIARAERTLHQAQPEVTLPQSTGATLHHQPTQQSVAAADSEAKNRLGAAISQARKLNSEGKDSECVATLEKVLPPGL